MARVGPVVASVIAWSVGAATAAGVGLIALSLIGTGLTDSPFHPLTDALAPTSPVIVSAPPPAPAPATTSARPTKKVTQPSTPSTPSTAPAKDRTVTSIGGIVVASCRAGGAYLVYWSPAPGYRADEVIRGPAATARLTFEADLHEVSITVRCVGGVAQPTVENDDRGDD